MPPNEGFVEAPARAFDYRAGAIGPIVSRAVIVEAPIQFLFGGAPFAVMMASPLDLEDFAYGFAYTEGVVESLDDIRDVAIETFGEGFRVDIALTAGRMRGHLARARALTGRTGCGVCGVEDFSQLPRTARRAEAGGATDPAAIGAALRALEGRQALNRTTRAAHGAAWCRADGSIHVLREDVGRHNALDKTIGALLRAGVGPDGGFLVITSRCSFEMVAKACAFGARTLVSVSAPTSMALARAESAGLALIAVAREDQALSFVEGARGAEGGMAA